MRAYADSVKAWIYARPGGTALILAVLVVAAIILLALTLGYRKKYNAHITGYAPFDTSAWKYGSVMDQGYFSPSLTPAQLSVYMPQLGGVRSELSRMMMSGGKGAWVPKRAHWAPSAHGRRAGFRTGLPHRALARKFGDTACPAGSYTVTDPDTGQPTCGTPASGDACSSGMDPVTDSTGTTSCICPPSSALAVGPGGARMCVSNALPPAPPSPSAPTPSPPQPMSCPGCEFCPHSGNSSVFNPITGTVLADSLLVNQFWDPSAVAEAQALADVGSYEDDHPATLRPFEAAINTARDADAAAYSMNDAQLSAIMSGGSAP